MQKDKAFNKHTFNTLIFIFNFFWNAFFSTLHAEIVDTFDSEPLKAENIPEDFSSVAEDTSFEVIDAPATYDSYPDSDFFGGKLLIFDTWLSTHITVFA